jgi:excisionase family DNA binding protein
MLTPKEAADQAGVSPQLVYRWCQERRLAHYRCGGRGRRGRILIDPADLADLLVSLRVEAAPPPDDSFRHHRRVPSGSAGAGGRGGP